MLFKRFLKIIGLVCIYQLAKFGDLISCGTTNHNDVTDLVNQGWLKIQKFEYLENGTLLFYKIKKFLTCASDDTFWVLRSYRFVAKLTFKQHFSIRNKTSSDSLSSLAHKFWELLNSTKILHLSRKSKQKLILGQSTIVLAEYIRNMLGEYDRLSFPSGFALLDLLFFYLTICTSHFLVVPHLVVFFLEISHLVFYSIIWVF